jgi:hypothetical protein
MVTGAVSGELPVEHPGENIKRKRVEIRHKAIN